jgi:hypothetical protein
MINATAMMEAARRNQMGQPAACSIANNRVPYRFSDCARGLYGKEALTRKLARCNKNALWVVTKLQAVVDFAISTKTCGQVCGLSMNSVRAARQEAPRVGRDQKLSSFLVHQNMPLAQRIGLRRARAERAPRPGGVCG